MGDWMFVWAEQVDVKLQFLFKLVLLRWFDFDFLFFMQEVASCKLLEYSGIFERNKWNSVRPRNLLHVHFSSSIYLWSLVVSWCWYITLTTHWDAFGREFFFYLKALCFSEFTQEISNPNKGRKTNKQVTGQRLVAEGKGGTSQRSSWTSWAVTWLLSILKHWWPIRDHWSSQSPKRPNFAQSVDSVCCWTARHRLTNGMSLLKLTV